MQMNTSAAVPATASQTAGCATETTTARMVQMSSTAVSLCATPCLQLDFAYITGFRRTAHRIFQCTFLLLRVDYTLLIFMAYSVTLGVDDIALVLQQNRLHWYGHVLRKDDDWVKKCMEYEVRVQDQEEDQRGPGERLSERIVKHVK